MGRALRRLIAMAGFVLALSGSGTSTTSAQGPGVVTAQVAPTFTWVTTDIPAFNAPTIDGASDGGLLASFGGDASFDPPVPTLWDTATGSSSPLAASGDYLQPGETAVTADGTHIFFSGPRTDAPGRCNLFVASRDGTSRTSIFASGSLFQPPGPCFIWPTGDGNRILFEVATLDPNLESQAGWYVADELGQVQRVVALNNSGPLGFPYVPSMSPNGVDAIVTTGDSTSGFGLSIVHLDGRGPTVVTAPAGSHFTPLPLVAGLDSTPRRPFVKALLGEWTPDGTHVAVSLTNDSTGATRLGILSMGGSVAMIGPADEQVLFGSWAWPVMSQDGTHIAYVTYGGAGLSLWVSRVDGSLDKRVSVELSDVAQIERAGSAYALLTFNSIGLGDRLSWISGDGAQVVPLASSGSGFEIGSIEWATPDMAYISGLDNLGPSGESGNAIYAIDLSGTGTPLRLIPYSEGSAGFFVTGVSADENRVSGWAQFSVPSADRGWTVTIAASPPLQRYVVLGDSVPYGHGLSDPKLNEPPSRLAYPELVRTGLTGLRPLSYRPSNCTLTGDQLAVSGAPALANALVSGDGECGVSVFPQELTDAQMQVDPPALVTIQAGADDIRFSTCLAAALGVPRTKSCTTGKDPNFKLTSKVSQALESLKTGLRATITSIHNQAPNAQILLLNYYQIIPEPDAQIVNDTGSSLCATLEAQSLRKGRTWRVALRDEADFIQGELNSAIKTVADAFPDVKLVDLANIFQNEEMCVPSSELFDGFSLLGTSTAGHPTAPGHEKIASRILLICDFLPKRCVGR